jgi:hypothetical protein
LKQNLRVAVYSLTFPSIFTVHFKDSIYEGKSDNTGTLKIHVYCKYTETKLILLFNVLGYGLDDRGSRVRFPAGGGNFSLHHRVQNVSGAHPASYPMGTRGSFPGVKRPEREADYSPPSSAEVKVCVEIYLHSPIRLHGMVLS